MIQGIVGLPGSGKTYYLSKLGLEAMKKGKKVYSNYKLEGAINYKELTELINVDDALILVDEINILCPSRKWDLLPTELLYWWSQTRKQQLDIYWTAQHQDRVDKAIKEVSAFIFKINALPFGIRIIQKFLPEQIGKAKRERFGFNIFLLKKNVFKKFNTYERITPAKYTYGTSQKRYYKRPYIPKEIFVKNFVKNKVFDERMAEMDKLYGPKKDLTKENQMLDLI